MTSLAILTISIPLTRADRQQAEKFKNMHPIASKADQVYENTLAVLATHHYLQMLDVPTELASSHSWNPTAFITANVADLYVPEARGRLECRAVRFGADHCFIPEEVWGDRLGYVVVRLNESNTEAVVLGFVPEVFLERLPLEDLQSLEDLIDKIGQKQPLPLTAWGEKDSNFPGWQIFENMREWLKSSHPDLSSSFALGLRGRTSRFQGRTSQELVNILHTSQDQEALWQAAEELWEIDPFNSASGGRMIMDLGMQLAGNPVSIIVAKLEKPDRKIAVLARVLSTEGDLCLPQGLRLTVLDAVGTPLREVEARSEDFYIQRKFIAETNLQFRLRVDLGELSFEEHFII